jgi:acyl carrier protein
LPAVDQKIIEIVGEYFQIFPSERLYLEPGTIAKTSSGKIRHQHNRQRFLQQNFDGLIEGVYSSQDDNGSDDVETKPSLELEIVAFFEKIVSLKPEFDQPILDCGADSVVIVEFVDQIEKIYQQEFEVEENTTLRDIARQIKQS